MKNIFLVLLLSLLSFSVFAQSSTVNAVHTDLRDGVKELHQDAEALYSDGKTAISSLHEDAKAIISTTYGDVKQIVGYMAPKLEAGLISLAQTLKTTVTEVFEILVWKQVAISISYLLQFIVGLVFLFIIFKIINLPKSKLLKDRPDNYGQYVWREQYVISLVGLLIGSLVLLANVIINFNTMVMGFIVPKYGAIMDLTNIVNSLLHK